MGSYVDDEFTRFSLATVQTIHGPQAAICIQNMLYPFADLECTFKDATVKSLLQNWKTAFPDLALLARDLKQKPQTHGIHYDQTELLTPVQYPETLLAVGANYADHLKEMGLAVERWASMPFFFRPPRSSLVGPGHTVIIPASTKCFDWECELAVVLGKPLRNATREQAEDAIAGYSIGLDLSCRDLIKTDNDLKIDLVRGKAQDTMAPLGPTVVPKQFMPRVDDLRIRLYVNGEKMMDASTKQMLYKCDEQLSIISSYVSLYAGDVLFTGSPSGSAGVHGNRWLRPGDHIHAEIDGIDALNVWMKC